MREPISSPMPLDQAHGLRRLFAHARVCVVPVVSNPNVAFGGVMLERLCTAFAEYGKHTLVVDAAERGGAISFEIPGVHPHDVATVLDTRGIAVRAGHHCAKPAHQRFAVQSSTRMSSYLYTSPAEIDALLEGLEYTRSYFKLG